MTRRLLHWAWPARGRLVELVALSVLITASFVAQGVLIAVVVDHVLDGDGLGSSWPALVGLGVAQALRALLLWRREVTAATCAAAVKESVRAECYRALAELGPGDTRRRRTGSLQATLVDGVETLDAYVGKFLPQAAAAVISAAAVAAFLIVIDPVVGLVVLGCGLLVPVVPALSDRLLRRRMDPWMASYRGLYAENLDAIQGMTTLTVFGARRRRGRQLTTAAELFCRDSIRLTAVVVLYVGVVGVAVAVGTALASGIGSLRFADGAIGPLALLMILLLTRECFRPLRDLQNAFHAAYPAITAAIGIVDLLDADRPVRDPAIPQPLPPGPPAVELRGVRFTYPGRSDPAVDDLSLTVPAGHNVAVVGRSGSGKSTIVGLLLRWFDPQLGEVLLGGVPVNRLPLVDLRAAVAVVSQDTYLFHRSVRANLQLGRPAAGDDELWDVLTRASAADVVRRLPHALDTVLGERGMSLSGGQRQRLSIARALLADAPVLILDEATSSVDAANERRITEALEQLSHGRTTLTIAHRLSTVRRADRIVVLDQGRIVEQGSHDELLATPAAFARLVAAQGAS